MAKECLERSHLETLKYTPPHLYFRHMHSRLRCSVKVNWAVETKELGTTLGEFYAHCQCRVVKKSFYFGSHIHHMSEKQRGSVLKTAASHHNLFFPTQCSDSLEQNQQVASLVTRVFRHSRSSDNLSKERRSYITQMRWLSSLVLAWECIQFAPTQKWERTTIAHQGMIAQWVQVSSILPRHTLNDCNSQQPQGEGHCLEARFSLFNGLILERQTSWLFLMLTWPNECYNLKQWLKHYFLNNIYNILII